MNSVGDITVRPEFLKEYKEIRELLWSSSDLLDDLGCSVPASFVWPKSLRSRFERIRSKIDSKKKTWDKKEHATDGSPCWCCPDVISFKEK